jgi:hypothetical protein
MNDLGLWMNDLSSKSMVTVKLLVSDIIEYVKKRIEKEKNKYVFLCTNFVKGNMLLVSH